MGWAGRGVQERVGGGVTGVKVKAVWGERAAGGVEGGWVARGVVAAARGEAVVVGCSNQGCA